ncbi:hypothetical protein [Pseudoroseomonas ludipueritiae]|uniref:Lipoprotein n=1 Tax=Pseudoroseomonas ludipueritiae TaxID=198093 RepID=A0ABR7R103_9PROT|nr:hypothetical protein [Pseudoroseomonas ludipueritiae]MBC9175414.1 hypothetical protein [Pseudoroseomonas ludipueritiae]MCG7362270.1 hypothetical protein [Roseomonas sp. ACRSG]
MFTRRVLPAFALAGSLLVAGCQNPDGSTDWGSTLALGAGAGLATALIAGAASDDGPRYYNRGPSYHGGYYGRPNYGRGYYGRGYRRGYGRW